MRNRVIYGYEGLYSNCCPSSGFHFINYAGELNNSPTDYKYVKDTAAISNSTNFHNRGEGFEAANYETYQPASPVGAVTYPLAIKDVNTNNFVRNENVLRKIDRVQSISYSVSYPRHQVQQINRRGLIDRPIIGSPEVSLQFTYLVNGVRNDHRLGLNVNFPMTFYPFNGEPFYSGNKVNLLSGITEDCLDRRDVGIRGEGWGDDKFTGLAFTTSPSYLGQEGGTVMFSSNTDSERANMGCFPANWPHYPYDYRDKRNFFIHVASEAGDDEKHIIKYTEDINTPWTEEMEVHPDSPNNECITFGDCYLNSYQFSARVGDFPSVSVIYGGDNMQFLNAASGENIPSLNPKDGQPITGQFIIPKSFENEGISALNQGDMTLDLEASNLGVSTTGINIQSLEFGFNLNRESLEQIGYQQAVDKSVNYPVVINGGMSILVGNMGTGRMIDFIHEDKIINFSIDIAAPECNFWKDSLSVGDFYPGVINASNYTAVNYTFLGARVDNISFSSAIGGNKTAQISFSVEIDPDDLDNGFFVSGVMNSEKIYNYLAFEHTGGAPSGDGVFLTDEDGSPLVVDMIPF
jgi:hypothetical protein